MLQNYSLLKQRAASFCCEIINIQYVASPLFIKFSTQTFIFYCSCRENHAFRRIDCPQSPAAVHLFDGLPAFTADCPSPLSHCHHHPTSVSLSAYPAGPLDITWGRIPESVFHSLESIFAAPSLSEDPLDGRGIQPQTNGTS